MEQHTLQKGRKKPTKSDKIDPQATFSFMEALVIKRITISTTLITHFALLLHHTAERVPTKKYSRYTTAHHNE